MAAAEVARRGGDGRLERVRRNGEKSSENSTKNPVNEFRPVELKKKSHMSNPIIICITFLGFSPDLHRIKSTGSSKDGVVQQAPAGTAEPGNQGIPEGSGDKAEYQATGPVYLPGGVFPNYRPFITDNQLTASNVPPVQLTAPILAPAPAAPASAPGQLINPRLLPNFQNYQAGNLNYQYQLPSPQVQYQEGGSAQPQFAPQINQFEPMLQQTQGVPQPRPWADMIADVMREQFGLKPKDARNLYQHTYPEWFERVQLPNRYKVLDFSKFSGQDSVSTYEHVSRFLAQCGEASATDALRVKLFRPEFRTKLIDLLKEYRDCFAWEYYEMPGLSRSIVEHRLPIKPWVRPHQQPPKRCKADMLEPVKAEIKRLYDAGFIRPCRYAEWVSSIVPVIKKNGKIRVCIDFRDLNKAIPKDEYPMPVADQLVDAASGHKILSFMDGNVGYNQIFMAEEDIHKTTFTCPGAIGLFEWVVMTFGLKSVGATYQRAMNYIYHDLIDWLVEVYNDDVVVKSKEIEDHIADLRKIQPPENKTELQEMIGKINFVRRFISNLSGRLEPFTPLLRLKADQKFTWGAEQQKALDNTKEYLSSAPVLILPQKGIPFRLYLSAGEKSIGSVLIQEVEEKERVVFYLSRRLLDAETSQLAREYESKNDTLMVYSKKCQKLMKEFRLVTLKHVSREQNVDANDLAQGASGYKPMMKDVKSRRGWGIDMIGMINPPSSKGHKFILVAADYFTKWIEVIPLKKVDSGDAIQFVQEHIVYRFGIPQTITTDQGSIFVSDEFAQFADSMGIKLLNSSPYYAQANGQAEASNKSLIKLIKRKISDYPRQWHTRLAEALWSYRMACHGSIQVPPYKLVYGHEAVLPWEVRIGSRRTELQNVLTADEYYNLMADEREYLVQSRLRALAKVTRDKERVARHYNKKVVPKSFSEGELV
uniref:Polyprotein n=2 Tax=Oryza sativa subsp. japonica TaxID=39947 RepID=A0A5S6R7M1_ORYSJ|nr:Putative polyprotein [Oryza sativa Japonica Group]AAP53498.1 retrotransposon protein, putative, unclassified [Oryza sativa Japonica Group]